MGDHPIHLLKQAGFLSADGTMTPDGARFLKIITAERRDPASPLDHMGIDSRGRIIDEDRLLAAIRVRLAKGGGQCVEGNHVEFKASHRKPKRDMKTLGELHLHTLVKSVCGFANTEGGAVVIGLPDTSDKAQVAILARREIHEQQTKVRDWILAAVEGRESAKQ